MNYLNGDIMTSSLTLPGSGIHLPRRKHSLHDVLDWDRPEPPMQTDALQRIVDIVKRTGSFCVFTNKFENYYRDWKLEKSQKFLFKVPKKSNFYQKLIIIIFISNTIFLKYLIILEIFS